MKDAQPRTIYLEDYRPPDFLIETTELRFELAEDHALVHSKLKLRRNATADPQAALKLDGQELELRAVAINDTPLLPEQYLLADELLTINSVPDEFYFSCITRIKPQENTSLEGLYKSQGMFCTQCEAQGFRKITYYLDRPDVMSVFTTSIIADGEKYPVLLSNGNEIKRERLADGRELATWHDPFKKPAYLFALVAGRLEFLQDTFTTHSNREISLRIYVEPKDLDKCAHAMLSLKNAMRWDEEVYGREYDLDIFMIVAVDDFNMGAMENKGLNIFNTSCVLAHPDTTTDLGFQRVEAVVAHEYFHNWSGNRVTCRDWFQLSLKEGFTVFRDAEFSADMGSRTVKRVEDVALLRTAQFAEDAGPMAHPIRPDNYMEISNFYTVTIYEKGAEVIRMLHTLLGPELFRVGSDLYFERHDGEAVTTDDFVRALEDASGIDLSQFRRWYTQAGTPELRVRGNYDEGSRRYTLDVQQSCPGTPGQPNKEPFHIPLAISLLGEAGSIRLQQENITANAETADNTVCVLDVKEAQQRFVFTDIPEPPVPSLLRGFSAPVKLQCDYTDAELLFLLRNDSDGFSRWDAGQSLAQRHIRTLVSDFQAQRDLQLDSQLVEAYRELLNDSTLDKSMIALMLELPSEAYLGETIQPVDVLAIHHCREAVRRQIAYELEDGLLRVYENNGSTEAYAANAAQTAQRSLRNRCLSYLMLLGSDAHIQRCESQFKNASNMTDTYAALRALVHSDAEATAEARQKALDAFYQRWQHEPLVVNQWLQVQASAPLPNVLAAVRELQHHPAYDANNPNKIRAVVGTFCAQNPINFHKENGSGYEFLADQVIELNTKNPQIAARLLGPLSKWRKYLPAAQQRMRSALERIQAEKSLSKDVYEVVSKSLK
ncbi:MAG: aminopeptidase N [Pseudomonadales bacterium]